MSCLDPRLVALLDALRAVASAGRFTVVSEYLGYLPYGQYVHIEVDGIDVSGRLPSTWTVREPRSGSSGRGIGTSRSDGRVTQGHETHLDRYAW